VFDAETTGFLEGSFALIVATVGPDGAPYATRAWGLTVMTNEAERTELRLLLDAADTVALEHVRNPPGAIAITGGDVATLRSFQLKGHVDAIEVATADDVARAARYVDEFFSAVEATDGTPRALMERLEPFGYVACRVTVRDRFDQTPGPGAGARSDAN
jgi:hypothetical protein